MKFEPKEEVKKEAPAEGEEGEEAKPAEGEEGEVKVVFKPEEFEWTISDKKFRNLPQIFVGIKGAK